MTKLKINEDNWLTMIIDNLTILQWAIEAHAITSDIYMIRDEKEKLQEIETLITYLNKTN